MVKSTLACGLQECLSKEWMGDNFSDFRVVVDGSEYFCHKFILSACSTFFKTLLNSDFRENKEECVELKNMSKETFDVIIKAIYKGITGLTLDNIIGVWQAVQLLDIPYLIRECEEFVIENMSRENFVEFCKMAKLFNAESVFSASINFMKENFDLFRETEIFLELSFPVLFSLVDDDNLNVESEDLVLESILKWVSYEKIKGSKDEVIDIKQNEIETSVGNSNITKEDLVCVPTGVKSHENPHVDEIHAKINEDIEKNCLNKRLSSNKVQLFSVKNSTKEEERGETYDRKKCLAELISTARTFLGSQKYLEKLLIHPLIMSFVEAHEIVYESLLYQWRSVSFPSNFVIPYRKCSGKRNVMAFVKNDKLHLFDINYQSIFTLDLKMNLEIKKFETLASTGSTLCFAYTGGESHCAHVKYVGRQQNEYRYTCKSQYIATFDANKKVSIICEECGLNKLQLVSLNGVFVKIINSTTTSHKSEEKNFICCKLMYDSSYDSVCVFRDNILFFDTCVFDKKLRVNVQCYNIYTKSTQDVNFEGPADHIVSFSTGARKNFILQKNGALRSVHVTDDSKIEFTFFSQLWNNFEWILNGAVYYKQELTLFCSKKPEVVDTSLVKSLPGIFGKINVVEIESKSNIVPLVVPESWLTLAK